MKVRMTGSERDARRLEKLTDYAVQVLDRIHDELTDKKNAKASLARAARAIERLDEDLDQVATRRALRALRARAAPSAGETPRVRGWAYDAQELEGVAGTALAALYTIVDALEDADTERAQHAAGFAIADMTISRDSLAERRAYRAACVARSHAVAAQPIVQAPSPPAETRESVAS